MPGRDRNHLAITPKLDWLICSIFHKFSVSCRDVIFPRLLCFGTADYSDCADRPAQSASSAADFPHYWACPVVNRVQLLCHDDLVEASKEMHLDPYIDEEFYPRSL